MDIQSVGIAIYNFFAGNARTIFDNNNFEVDESLVSETFEKLVYLIGTIVDRDYDWIEQEALLIYNLRFTTEIWFYPDYNSFKYLRI